jgi:Lipocalin-like domain
MLKKILPLLLLICSTVTHAQQKLKPSDIIGVWQISALVTDGITIPLETDEATKVFLMEQAGIKKGEGAMLTSQDSAGIDMAVQMMGMFRQSTFLFNANKTFQFTLTIGDKKDEKKGTWTMNEATQIIRITEIKKGKPAKSEIFKIIIKGSQLLVQMEKDKEEGFLISRKQ